MKLTIEITLEFNSEKNLCELHCSTILPQKTQIAEFLFEKIDSPQDGSVLQVPDIPCTIENRIDVIEDLQIIQFIKEIRTKKDVDMYPSEK